MIPNLDRQPYKGNPTLTSDGIFVWKSLSTDFQSIMDEAENSTILCLGDKQTLVWLRYISIENESFRHKL